MDLEGRLRAMFADDPANAERYLPPYEFDSQLGAKPWFPPLAEVWARQGKPRHDDRNASWPDAWRLLQQLKEHYE